MIVFLGASVSASFSPPDAAGNTGTRIPAQTMLVTLTPLAALELLEQLHAARNAIRAKFQLPEIATDDVALVLLAFLRRIAASGETELDALPDAFRATVAQILEARK